MADYSEILDTQIEPDAPLTAVLAGQWRDNVLAIAEGAPDAPRLYGKAAVPRSQQAELPVLSMSASDDVTLEDLHYSGNFVPRNTSSSNFQSAGIITSVLMTGTVRFRARQNATTALGTPESQIRILKNGSVVQTWTSTTSSNRSIDLSVAVGDTFEWQVRYTNGNESATIDNISENATDGYVRIGIPIRASDL